MSFKVKLASGRVLGPLDLERIRLLVLRGHITGTEIAREYPHGEWQDINRHVALAELFVAKAEGRLGRADERRAPSDILASSSAATVVLPSSAPTVVLPETKPSPSRATIASPEPTRSLSDTELVAPELAIDREEKTYVSPESADSTRSTYWTDVREIELEVPQDLGEDLIQNDTPKPVSIQGKRPRRISEEKTVLFERSSFDLDLPGKAPSRKREKIRLWLSIVAVALVGYELLWVPEQPPKRVVERVVAIRPRVPEPAQRPDPAKSAELYQQAMVFYVEDTLEGYQQAAQRLLAAASFDPNNVKALAMLASSYLNLIDASSKDENYFSVISKLIDMSRAKAVDLPESVIADVEFYLTANKPEAAQDRIVDYTRSHAGFGSEMFFYLAQTFYARGDYANAARYIAQFPEAKVYSARIFYLRGQIAEKLGDIPQALREYRLALGKNPRHAKSHLRIAQVLASTGSLKDATEHLKFLAANPKLLPPKELAQGYFLRAQYLGAEQQWDHALGEIERAVRLDRNNSDYLLHMYGLRARAGDSNPAIKEEVKMYHFLSEGERHVKAGRYADALASFQQARQMNLKSAVPPEKIGDMFLKTNDVANARAAYRLAAERAGGSIEIWSKYIDTLIQSYEWEEAQRAMDRFRKLPVSQSALDRLAGDIYARQNRHAEAQVFYRKAMARDVIDPSVYVAYAKSLMATQKYKDAAFFFALALRFDPTNMEAILGTARSVAASDSIDRAIVLLQDELLKGGAARAELLTGIAEFQIQRADWAQAESLIQQAMAANPDYAEPWRLMAQVHLNREQQDRRALDKALDAYKSYSDRNPSDPSGYLDRYKIFLKKTEFEKAGEELNRIYAIYPKYPALHYFKGALYSIMGNQKAAIEEFQTELKNNPQSVATLMALGKEHLAMNAPREALGYFSKAMLLAPASAEPKHQAAWANHLLKNFQGAAALYQSAIALDPANPLLYKRLGMAYRELGNQPQARQAFKKYLQMEPDAPDRALFERFL